MTPSLAPQSGYAYDAISDGHRELLGKDGSFVRTKAWEKSMSDDSGRCVFHSNHYTAQSACEHCQGIIRHERWCITVDRTVYYAYEIITDANKLTVGDAIILHSLGVLWANNKCEGKCNASALSHPRARV